MIQTIRNYFLDLQNRICYALEQEDATGRFMEDNWERPEGGGGKTRVITGSVIEKGGVNFSHIHGSQLPAAATIQRPELVGSSFQALGVSLVIHPWNPYAPTVHLNVRFFIAEKLGASPIWWFGGGFDLTPYYGFIEDCKHWHITAQAACEPFGSEIYPRYKKACDDYFFLKNRNEQRGIGGLFFDDLNEGGIEKCFQFVQSIGDHFIPAYLPILGRRKDIPYSDHERNFQCYRRGRYVEFNLLYDRGTLFGLQSGGRTESILMSLPPQVQFIYNWHPEKNTEEERLYNFYLKPKNWILFDK